MDVLCDTLIVEEILPHMLPKCLLRFAVTCRHYNALARCPEFAARYWHRAGVFFQPLQKPVEFAPRFLTSPPNPGALAAADENNVPGADLAFLPEASAEEKAYLRRVGRDPEHGIAIVHSAGGLLLCSRGRTRSLHYYICNPMTWQWVALPELPLPVCTQHYGHLIVATGTREEDGAAAAAKGFQVVLTNHPEHWLSPGEWLDLRVFTSDTGQWETRRFPACPIPSAPENFCPPPILAQSGTSYWMSYPKDQAIAYNRAAGGGGGSIRVVALPKGLVNGRWNRCIGERHGGGLRYVHSDLWVLEVWDYSSSQQGQSGSREWTLVHGAGFAELMERNPEAAAFMRGKDPSDWRYHHVKPVGIHPTDDDVVFVSLPGAVFAYSIEHGTMNLQCTHGCFTTPADTFPYVHPPYPVQISAIRSSSVLLESPRKSASYVGTKRKRDLYINHNHDTGPDLTNRINSPCHSHTESSMLSNSHANSVFG